MYNFYPANETYTGESQTRLIARASQAELEKWGYAMAEETDMQDAENMAKADRFAAEPTPAVQGVLYFSDVSVEM